MFISCFILLDRSLNGSVYLTVTGSSKWPACVVGRGGWGLCRRWGWRWRRPRSDVEHGVGGWWTGRVDLVQRQAISAVSASTGTNLEAGTCRLARRTCRQHHLVVCLSSSTNSPYSKLSLYADRCTGVRAQSSLGVRDIFASKILFLEFGGGKFPLLPPSIRPCVDTFWTRCNSVTGRQTDWQKYRERISFCNDVSR